MTLRKFKDDLGKDIYGISPSEAIEQGICIDCKEPALPKCYSEAGRREYRISALCETCFDAIFDR